MKKRNAIIKGDNIKCSCGKNHIWQGYKKGIMLHDGFDCKGWYLKYWRIKEYSSFVEYVAVCPLCQAKEKKAI